MKHFTEFEMRVIEMIHDIHNVEGEIIMWQTIAGSAKTDRHRVYMIDMCLDDLVSKRSKLMQLIG